MLIGMFVSITNTCMKSGYEKKLSTLNGPVTLNLKSDSMKNFKGLFQSSLIVII